MSDEAEVRELLGARAERIRRRDAGGAVSFYAEDVVHFDLAPPLAYRGREATDPAELQAWFDTWNGPVGLSFRDLEVRVGGDVALTYGLLHMTGLRTDGSHTDVWVRITVGLERRAGRWSIVHEHQSFPTRMDGSGLSADDLAP